MALDIIWFQNNTIRIFLKAVNNTVTWGKARWWKRKMCAHLLWKLQNCNSLLNNHWQENVRSHPKKIPHFLGQRESPQKMVGGTKSHLESNPIPSRDAQKAQTKPCAHQDPGTPQETEPELFLSVWMSPAWVSCSLLWGQGLWLQQTWKMWCVSPTIEPLSRQPTKWRTIIPKSSHIVVKVLGPTTDFPT